MNSDYGTYGVLRFLKKNDDSIVANYPIDDETLTFGKSADCNIRLYYPAVSQQHAKIIFKENKAFLLIYGGHGVHVDGCTVFPSTSSGETAVPLTNNTVLEISKKRFRFEYPPKPYRAALAAQINTPTQNPSKRRTRFSMIQSTEVFSPRPDPDPKVNLRILQSPLRRSPLKAAASFEEEEEPPIVLVESNHPRVMEDDQDLVIIEDVPRQEPVAQTPTRVTVPLIPRQQQQFSTPHRKPPRNSLHRAVLIRSAQKAALREIAREEDEERDVDTVEMIIEEGSVEQEEDVQPQDVDDEEEEDMDVDEEEDVLGDDERGRSTGLSSWRRGVEAVRNGLRALSRSLSPEKETEQEEHEKNPLADDDEDEDVQTSAPLVSDLVSASQRAALERPSEEFGSPLRSPAKPSRESLSLADRVRGSGRVSLAGISRSPLKPSQPLAWKAPRGEERVFAQTSPRRVSAEERHAIQERRRQSLATPDAFWAKNGVPGSRSPAKAGIFPSASEPTRIAAPNFGIPVSTPRAPATPPPAAPPGLTSFDEFMSPSRAWGASRSTQEPVEEVAEEEEPDEMLQRLKNTIGDMKRRKSMRSEEDETRLRALVEKEQNKAHNDQDEDDATVEDVAEPEGVAGPSIAREATPEIELRHVFNRPTATPRLSGVRDLHRRADADARVRNAGTPALDGMQEMFSRPSVSRRETEREDIIPSSDDEEARAAVAAEEHDSEEEAEPEPALPPVRAPARNARLKKSETMPTIARTAGKTAPVRKTASTSRIATGHGSGRSTPIEEVHQDHQPATTRARTRTATGTKPVATKASGSQQVARSTVKVTKTVERAPRSRKATDSDEDVTPAATKAPAKKPAARTTKPTAPARSTAASTRSKKSPSDSTPDPLDESSGEDEDAAPVASRVRQRHATGSSQQDDDDDKPRATRRTPARTAAARKPAAAPTRKTTAKKAAPEKENTPDRVKEEEEEQASPPPPPPPARATRRAAVRKADAGGQSEPEQAQTKARPARTRAATRG